MNRRTKALVIVNWRDLDHPEAGGAETYCEEVARALAARGRRVVLLTAAVAGRPATEERNGYRIIRRGGRYGVYPAVLVWLLTHRRRIDGVIDSQNGIPFFAPLVVGRSVPVVLLVHHVHQEQFGAYFSPLAARIGRWLEGPVSRKVYGDRAVAAVSPSTRRAVRLQLHLAGPISIATPGCRAPERVGREVGERSVKPTVVCVARMVRHKRLELALTAFEAVVARWPDAELQLVGDGSERPALEHLASRMSPGRVIFHGALGDGDRDAVVRAAWVALNTSAGEGWGISVIEANSLGVPVVGMRVAGLRDSIRDGETGWLVDDPRELGARLADAIATVADLSAAERWSERAVAWAARAEWAGTATILDNLLESERGRLRHSDRRQSTDLATHVHLPSGLLPPGWSPAFRLTDRMVSHDRGVSVVLPGSEVGDVAAALRRAGLPPGIVHDPRLRVRLARPSDFVDPIGTEHEDGDGPAAPSLTVLGSAAGTIT